MSNYPNMSYCMFENTASALAQVIDAMTEADSLDDLDLNEYDQFAMNQLAALAAKYQREYNRLAVDEEETA